MKQRVVRYASSHLFKWHGMKESCMHCCPWSFPFAEECMKSYPSRNLPHTYFPPNPGLLLACLLLTKFSRVSGRYFVVGGIYG